MCLPVKLADQKECSHINAPAVPLVTKLCVFPSPWGHRTSLLSSCHIHHTMSFLLPPFKKTSESYNDERGQQ